MGMTIAEKIIALAAGVPEVKAGDFVKHRISCLCVHKKKLKKAGNRDKNRVFATGCF